MPEPLGPRRVVVVKVGSSTLVDGDGRARADAFARLAGDCLALRRAGTPVVVVSSGAVALGLGAVGRSRRRERTDELQAASALGQTLLQARWQAAFGGVPTGQVLLTLDDVARRPSYLNARRTLRRLLLWGAVPVVNENDSTATPGAGFGDNDRLSAHVGVMTHARLLVLLSDVDGVVAGDPRDAAAETVAEVPPGGAARVAGFAAPAGGAWGSGGMAGKVAAAAAAADCGVEAVIASGGRPGAVTAAAAGRPVGTRFRAHPHPPDALRAWLRHGTPVRGRLLVDAGARSAVARVGTSLLPVGVTQVEGRFAAGDAVEVAGPDGRPFAVGLSRYACEEVRGLAGRRGAREVIRASSLVLLGGDAA